VTAFGQSPLGTGPGPFGGPGLITVLGVLPLSNGEFVVVFDTPPEVLDPQAFTSATNEENFALAAIDPSYTATDGTVVVPPGEFVPTRFPKSAIASEDPDGDPTQIVVAADSALQPRVRYEVTISPSICGANGETFAGPNVFEFRAPGLSRQLSVTEISQERYRDFDYIIEPRPGEVSQVYRQDANGDIGLQDAVTSLRKRIYRRVFTDPGAFSWLPEYGVGVKVKSLARAGRLQELAGLIAEQIKAEPDVVNAGVEVSVDRTGSGTFVNIAAFVQQRDATTRRLLFSEPLS